jgi:hypothetical protein
LLKVQHPYTGIPTGTVVIKVYCTCVDKKIDVSKDAVFA